MAGQTLGQISGPYGEFSGLSCAYFAVELLIFSHCMKGTENLQTFISCAVRPISPGLHKHIAVVVLLG